MRETLTLQKTLKKVKYKKVCARATRFMGLRENYMTNFEWKDLMFLNWQHLMYFLRIDLCSLSEQKRIKQKQKGVEI